MNKKTERVSRNCKPCAKGCDVNIMAGEKYFDYYENGKKKYEHKMCPKKGGEV